MATIEIIEEATGVSLVRGPLILAVPRKGEWVKLRDITYVVFRVVHEFIPIATGSADLHIRVYVDRL